MEVGIPGSADIYLWLPGGRFVFVEVKRRKKARIEILQKRFRELAEKLGFEYYIVKNASEIRYIIEQR